MAQSSEMSSVKPFVSKVWKADLGNGWYKNPVINADYSDPDAIRVGEDFYLVSSSFSSAPGLPILHSKDLVNWSIIGHALDRQIPMAHFAKPRHGDGVWAPALRFHNGLFYLYYPDPDFGIYLVTAKQAAGPWSEPMMVEAGKGLIDPCPFWDTDGTAYLIHGFAGSRAGIKSLLVIKKMNPAGNKILDAGVIVYDGHVTDPTIEGPKLYKRHQYYYIFAPAGGVTQGWQLVLRSKNIYGPYERKIVMDQGSTSVNGPHQGAWVSTAKGEDWFLHFQDKGVYGRVLHLQPMHWLHDWPVIGVDKKGDGKGEPVLTYQKPDIGKTFPVETPVDSDEFTENKLGNQWQWQANPKAEWSFMNLTTGTLRLYSAQWPDSAANLWDLPNLLLQKFPADSFMATCKLSFYPNKNIPEEKTGLVIMGRSYAGLSLQSSKKGIQLDYTVCRDAEKGRKENEQILLSDIGPEVYLRVSVKQGGICYFSYSQDGNTFTDIPQPFQAAAGRWVGAQIGLFCTRKQTTNDAGYADFDWFRFEPVK